MEPRKPYHHLKDSEPYWPDNAVYFYTDTTFLHFPFFANDDQKHLVREQIKKVNTVLGIPISAFSIARNHIHVKFYLRSGLLLAEVKKLLRGGISFAYGRRYNKPYKEMWQSCKTLVVYNDEIDWKITAYINGNLLKHREVGCFSELYESRYSSYRYYVDKYGEGEVNEAIRRVLVADEDKWGGIDLAALGQVDVSKPDSTAL